MVDAAWMAAYITAEDMLRTGRQCQEVASATIHKANVPVIEVLCWCPQHTHMARIAFKRHVRSCTHPRKATTPHIGFWRRAARLTTPPSQVGLRNPMFSISTEVNSSTFDGRACQQG